MRRKDREMDETFAWDVFDRALYMTLSMIDETGEAYAVPLSLARAPGSTRVYFHCAHTGKKIAAIQSNPQVCLSGVGETRIPPGLFTQEYESFIATGVASFVTDDKEKVEALRLICQRYTPENMANFGAEMARSFQVTTIIAIDIADMTGKRKRYDAHGVEMKWGRQV